MHAPTPPATSGTDARRPLLHALLDPGVAACSGVELDRVKVVKAAAFFALAAADLRLRQISLKLTPTIRCSAIEQVAPAARCTPRAARRPAAAGRAPAPPQRSAPASQVATLDPATHAYSFWEGVPPSGKQAFGRLFAASTTLVVRQGTP